MKKLLRAEDRWMAGLVKAAESGDYKLIEVPRTSSAMIFWLKAAPPGITKCQTNDKPPNLGLYGYKMQGHCTAELEVVGEQKGVWYTLRAYGLIESDVERLPDVEASLLRAWEAVGT